MRREQDRVAWCFEPVNLQEGVQILASDSDPDLDPTFQVIVPFPDGPEVRSVPKKGFDPSHTRTFAVVGHRSAGKTSLGDVLLQATGATREVGRVDQGTSLLDHTAEAHARHQTLEPGTAWLTWRDHQLNLVDTPGAQDLVHDVGLTLHVVDGFVLVVAANDGVEHGTERALELADAKALPGVAVVHQADRPHDLAALLEDLQRATERKVLPLQLPFLDDAGVFAGVVDLPRQRAMRYDPEGSGAWSPEPLPTRLTEAVSAAWEKVVEAVAVEDEELLEEYLEYLELPVERVLAGLADLVRAGRALPVLFTSSALVAGAEPLLDAIVDMIPAADLQQRPGLPDDDEFSATVVHTSIDAEGRPFTLLRVWTGQARLGDFRTQDGRIAKVRKVFQVRGPRRAVASTVGAGAIVATWDPVPARPGETLSESGEATLRPPVLPPVMVRRVVLPRTAGDNERLERALPILLRMDHALELETDPLGGELVLCGRTVGQVERAASWLRRRMGVAVDLELPRVSYREAPKEATSAVEGVHVHESSVGLVEEFGRCALDLSPEGDSDDIRYEAKCDEEELPRRFHAAIGEGARQAARSGPLAGFPVIGARVTCVDGAYDMLVSNEEHFQKAGAAAMRAALEQAGTRLLEPWLEVQVHGPADAVGALIQDLNAQRGRIQDVNVTDHACVQALLPEREASTLASRVSALTGGRGWFTSRHSHYDVLPETLIGEALRTSPVPSQPQTRAGRSEAAEMRRAGP